MSFNMNKTGKGWEAGYFLMNDENCVRETRQISATGVTADADGAKIVKAGTIYPSNDKNAVGIVYENVDVTSGNMPGSIVTKGEVYIDRLPVAPSTTENNSAKDALEGLGFKFSTAPTVTR